MRFEIENLTHVVARNRDDNALSHIEFAGEFFEFRDVRLPAGHARTEQEQLAIQSAIDQSGEKFDRIRVTFQTRTAARQRQQRAALECREIHEETAAPRVVRLITVREVFRIDTARNDGELRRIRPRIVAQHVIAHGVRYADHALAAGED